MRFRLLRHRLTINSPRMAVRSALPWPFRWAMAALVFGFCAAIALWAFEFGKVIAGIDAGTREELVRLQSELTKLKVERDQAQSIANTSQTLLTAEKAAQEQLLAQKKQLESDNLSLRDDLGFFEKLIPSTGVEGIVIRGLQAEVQEDRRLRWRILLIQPQKNVAEFKGGLDITVMGLLNGKPWTMGLPNGAQAVKFTQFGRFQGVLELPPQAVVKSVSVKVLEGSQVKATQSVSL